MKAVTMLCFAIRNMKLLLPHSNVETRTWPRNIRTVTLKEFRKIKEVSKELDAMLKEFRKIKEESKKLEAKLKDLEVKLEDQEIQLEDLHKKIDSIILGEYAQTLFLGIVKHIFPDRDPQPAFKSIMEIEWSANGSHMIKMSEQELQNWNTFVTKLHGINISVAVLHNDIKTIIELRNIYAHPRIFKVLNELCTYTFPSSEF